MLATIGNGLYCPTKQRPDGFRREIQRIREKQAKCPHSKRDPKERCYDCGQKDGEWGSR